MSNTNVFDQVVKELINGRVLKKVTLAEFERFNSDHWILYVLKGYRFGQAFCDHFDIPTGTPLYYFNDYDTCARWIKENYIEDEEKVS